MGTIMALFTVLAMFALPLQIAQAQQEDLVTLKREVLAKAIADECYLRGTVPTQPEWSGDPGEGIPTCGSGVPRVNQSYIWGLVQSGNDLWFGTMANTECLVMGTYLGITRRSDSGSYVCEFGSSQYP
jgi:hypothetical protein